MYRLSLTILLLFTSLPCFAHVGHDHSDPMASLIHLAWIAPLLIVAVVLINKLVKHQNSLNKKQ
jgi:hypothetical protein